MPDWDSHADDGGRADLLRSLRFARQRVADADSLVLVGWSRGGVAAAGLTINARDLGVRFAHTVCLAGAFMAPDPIFGGPLAIDRLAGDGPRAPFTLVHGMADDVVPIAASRAFASTLEQIEWPVEFVELAADHGAIAGARYDRTDARYSAAADPQTLAIAADVAARIAAVCGRASAR